MFEAGFTPQKQLLDLKFPKLHPRVSKTIVFFVLFTMKKTFPIGVENALKQISLRLLSLLQPQTAMGQTPSRYPGEHRPLSRMVRYGEPQGRSWKTCLLDCLNGGMI